MIALVRRYDLYIYIYIYWDKYARNKSSIIVVHWVMKKA